LAGASPTSYLFNGHGLGDFVLDEGGLFPLLVLQQEVAAGVLLKT
jgi:hypothetical protein